jgi:DNA-directed RNA polymerase subunit alpha
MKTRDLSKLCKLVLDTKNSTNFYGRFAAEPFERGYGHTIGNSLRRILLSSIEGVAITSIRIQGAMHEFTVLKGVKEDVAQIILNLKKVRAKLLTAGSEKLILKTKKGGRIVAGDINSNPNVEIMNPDQEIANVDSGVSFEMEMEVSLGKGYVLAEELEDSSVPIGTIFLDSLFSPVTKVNYEVENTRVERSLNYDKLIMEIWTDGSISPKDALIHAAKILRNSLVVFTGDAIESEEVERLVEVEKAKQEEEQSKVEEEENSKTIDSLGLSARASNALKNANVNTLDKLVKIGEEGLKKFDKLGKRSLEEIKEKLAELGIFFGVENSIGEKNDKDL